MKLVQHHRPHAAQQRIGEQLPQKHSLGDVAQPGLFTADAVEAHLHPDRAPELLPPLLRDTRRREVGRQPPRLEHYDIPIGP